jgi:cardiolipin synthase A/B
LDAPPPSRGAQGEAVATEHVEIIPRSGVAGETEPDVLPPHEMLLPARIPPGEEGLCLALQQSTGVPLLRGNHVELVENGRVFDAMVEEIRLARRSIHILLYIWRPCAVSDRVIEAITERSRHGVVCRVVVDPVGSEEISGDRDFDLQIESRLRAAGAEVHYFRVLTRQPVIRLGGRNHQKIVVVDGRVGITGGFGLWKEWDGDGVTSWRDSNVRLRGPAVMQLQVAFARAWQESGGPLLPAEEFPEHPEDGPARAGFVTSIGSSGISDAERMLRMVFAAARRRIWISNAYFTPPEAILLQLEEKRRQGVDVQILAPGGVTDQRMVLASQRSVYGRLLRLGARIWEYQPSMMHAKTILVDDWLSVVGSVNLDALSLNRLAEGSLIVSDRPLAAALERAFLRDLRHAREVKRGFSTRNGPIRHFARWAVMFAGRDRS